MLFAMPVLFLEAVPQAQSSCRLPDADSPQSVMAPLSFTAVVGFSVFVVTVVNVSLLFFELEGRALQSLSLLVISHLFTFSV